MTPPLAPPPRQQVLPYTPDQLFELVGDIDRYPEFVPWVTGIRVWNRIDDGQGTTGADAEASVGFSFLKERFSTRVRRYAAERRITVSLLSGPFRKLSERMAFFAGPCWELASSSTSTSPSKAVCSTACCRPIPTMRCAG